MGIYTYFNFRYFGLKSWEKKERLCRKQNQAMFLLHGLAYLILLLKAPEELFGRLLAFYGMQVVFFVCYGWLYRLFYRNISRLLLNDLCMLLCVGLIMLTRLSLEKAQPLSLAYRQFALAVASAVVTWLIPLVIDRVWQLSKIPWVYAGAGLVFLIAVCVLGSTSNGAKLAITIAGVAFQPSEFVKISFVFFVAALFYRSADLKTVGTVTAVAAAHVLVLVLSKDLGSALIFFTTYLAMVFVATSKWLYLALGIGGGCSAAVAAYYLFSHVRIRVDAWRNPWADIDNRGYQITQSLFALGTGGWFGMGLYQGMPGKIPVVEKDFIFSAISEELGAIFAVCVILIYLGCFLQFMMIAGKMQAVFYKLIAFGLGIVYIVQVFLNIGGVIKFIPSTGVTLPLISYGGSSLLSTFMMFGVIQGLYLLKRNEEEEYG